MASAERLPSKRWRGLYRDAAGRKCRVPGTFGRKSDAVDAAQEAEVGARRKAAAKGGKLSARTTWGDWWAVFNAERTFNSDNGIVERQIVEGFLMKRWGDVPLNSITRQDVQLWVDGLRRKYSSNYVRGIYRVLRVSINGALDAGVLTASPTSGVKLPRVPKRAKPYVSTDDSTKMRANLHERYRDAVEFTLETGLRPSELAGLHANRVDLESGWVTVAEVHVRRSSLIRPHPKDDDVRKVPLSAKAIEIVRRRLADRDLTTGCGVRHSDGIRCASPLVFLNVRDGVLNSDLLGRHMRQAAKAAGLPAKSGYGLRRGFATRAIDGGLDVFAVKRLMGHADLEELEGYVQETPAARARLLASLGERPTLAAVEERGTRGTGRGTDSGNHVLPAVTKEGETDTA
jgi:integrase